MSEKKEKIFDGIWNELDATDKNKVVVKHLKTLSKWDLKRVVCAVLDVDLMDDASLSERFNDIVWTR